MSATWAGKWNTIQSIQLTPASELLKINKGPCLFKV